MEQIKTFISYAHDDDPFFRDFVSRLKKGVKNSEQFTWNFWDDRDIYVGTFWDEAIQEKIQDCNIAILLVSMSFMASKYIKENEFENLKQRYAEKGVLIVPILFAPCDFHRWEDLGKIQFFKPKGSEYGRPELLHFTYSDLLTFKNDGTILPAPNADRYILKLVKSIESSFKDFLKQPKKKDIEDDVIVNIPFTESTNKLSEYPKPMPYFTGRDQEINEFKAAIDSGINLIVVDGPGGIGKTQFVSRCIEKFILPEKIIWYECTSASHLDTVISEAGYPELLKGNTKTEKEKFSVFKDKIQKNGLFLFLDNFQETNSNPVFREFLVFIQTYLKNGCVVVIDRDDIRNSVLTPKRIHIEGFREKQLEYARGLISHSFNEIQISDNDLKNLCEQLHGYPFAINLAILLLSQGESSSDILKKIVQFEDDEKISERLLNAIFSRRDASDEEKSFIIQFSIFAGRVTDDDIRSIFSDKLIDTARKQLQQKNLLSYRDACYEVHPLVREFCYKRLLNKEALHVKVSDYYKSQRTDILDSALEERIFYHLLRSEQWQMIDNELEINGRRLVLQGFLDLVKELLDKLLKLGINKPILSILSGDIAKIQGNWNEALSFFNIAMQNDIDKNIQIEGIIKYAEILYNQHKAKDALPFFVQAYELSEGVFRKHKVRAVNGLGIVNNWFGEKKLAVEYFHQVIALGKELDDKEMTATALLSIGSTFYEKDEFAEALKYFKNALDDFISIGDKIGIATTIREIGNVFLAKRKYNEAIKKYENSISVSEEIGDKIGILSTLANMGNVYYNLNQFDKALKQYGDCKKIAEEINDRRIIATIHNNIAHIYGKQNKIMDAINECKKGLVIMEGINDISGIAITCLSLGELYVTYRVSDHNHALVYLFRALAIYNKLEIKSKSNACINFILQLRDKIGLLALREVGTAVYDMFDTDLRNYIPFKELIKQPIVHSEPKMGRNDPCYCGSGKKFKQCHGKKF